MAILQRRARPALAAAAGLVLVACAAPMPALVSPTFAEPTSRRPVAVEPGAVVCSINVSDVVDVRRAPDVLGVVAGRAVKAPADSAGWLRSVVAGLGTRGFTVLFADPAAPADAISAKFTLHTAWITDTRGNKTANVVLLVAATRPGGATVDRAFRGNVSMINWASTESEMQDVMARAFADALDDVARDLKPLCST